MSGANARPLPESSILCREANNMSGSQFYSGNLLALIIASSCALTPLVSRAARVHQTEARSEKQTSETCQAAMPSNQVLHKEQSGKSGSDQLPPASHPVTVRLTIEKPNGPLVANLRRDDFAVYENGVRQRDITVEVEHLPITVALLLEFGGRYHELNEALADAVPQIGKELIEAIGRDDKIAVFDYNEKLNILADFNQGQEHLDSVFDHLSTPGFSEANLYDALLETLNRLRDASGRKAIIVVSSGLDTFSKTTYSQLVQAARNSLVPIYTIGLSQLLPDDPAFFGHAPPLVSIEWNEAERRLREVSKVSNGQAYRPDSPMEISAIRDDIVEQLRLQYVITYVSSNRPTAAGKAPKIRVELIDPRTDRALTIRDSSGNAISPRVLVQEISSKAGASHGG
jgi:Ca-activated chloride channel family protein